MKLLVDTHLLLIAGFQPDRLGSELTRQLLNPAHELWFSAASIWELASRGRWNRADFDLDPAAFRDTLLANSYRELPVDGRHASALPTLPDAAFFARILLSQAVADSMILLTNDPALAGMPGPIRYFAPR